MGVEKYALLEESKDWVSVRIFERFSDFTQAFKGTYFLGLKGIRFNDERSVEVIYKEFADTFMPPKLTHRGSEALISKISYARNIASFIEKAFVDYFYTSKQNKSERK